MRNGGVVRRESEEGVSVLMMGERPRMEPEWARVWCVHLGG